MGIGNLTMEYEGRLLAKENIPESVKKAILKFADEDLLLEELTEKRRMNYIQRLRVSARWIPDSFLNPDKNDIRKIMIKLSDGYSDWTKNTYLKMLKKFYRKTLAKEKFEDLFDGVKIKQPKPKVLQSDLITQSEMDKIIDNCKNSRDRAIFSTLYDSGCRIGELLLMKIKSVNFDNYGANLEVPLETKTGTRTVRIIGNSIPYLTAWLDSHPDRNNPEAPLFCNLSDSIRGRAMTYDDVHKALGKILKRAGITRKINPHLFRHTRASILASKPLAASVFEDQMGWIHGSKQTQTYVHLSGKQQDLAILKAYGVNVEEDTGSENLPKKCPRCSNSNPYNSTKCRICWMPLTTDEAIKQIEKENAISEILKSGDLISETHKQLLQNLPEESKLDVLATLLLDFEKSGKLDLIKQRITKAE